MILVLVGSLGVQSSSALMLGVFDSVGVYGASAIRLAGAAIVLLAVFRPSLRGRTRTQWSEILLFGATMAAMNTLLYLAIDRLPLGIVVTINFLGPCVVALLGSRGVGEGALAVLAFAGVSLIAGLGGAIDVLGLLYAVLAAVSLGLYVLLAARVGKQDGGFQTLALALGVAAVLLAPLGIRSIPGMEPGDWGVLVIGATWGLALACVGDTLAGRLTSARVIGVLFAIGPVVGVLIGTFWLGQMLTWPVLVGIALILGAGTGIVWLADPVASASSRIPADEGESQSDEV